jgi:hypothetical protein
MEIPIHKEEKGVVTVEGYRTAIPVYHPVYAPVHPSACFDREELNLLLTSGWYTSPEAMALGVSQAPANVSDSDKDVDRMLAEERGKKRK